MPIIFMYTNIKSKKISFNTNHQSPLLFCCFINNEQILALFENKYFSIVSASNEDNRIICNGNFKCQNVVTDCKRVKLNTCACLTNISDRVYFITYLEDKQMAEISQIFLKQSQFFSQLKMFSELIVFNQHQFVIQISVYQDKTMHFIVLKQKQGSNLHYQAEIITQQIQWINQNYEIVQPLPKSKEFALYKQRWQDEADNSIKLISIQYKNQQKYIQLGQHLAISHLIIEIIAKQDDQYLIFLKDIDNISKMDKLNVWKCRMYNSQGKFAQSLQILSNFLFDDCNFTSTLSINYAKKIIIAKCLSLQKNQSEPFDNYLTIIKLQTGQVLHKLNMNLKQYDLTPNQDMILDYSQEINTLDTIFIHIRNLLDKKVFYHYLINNFTCLKGIHNQSFYAEIMNLL